MENTTDLDARRFHNETCADDDCPGCGDVVENIHENDDGTYTCPRCDWTGELDYEGGTLGDQCPNCSRALR